MFELRSLLNYSARQTVSRWGVTLIDTRLSGHKWTSCYGLVVFGRQAGRLVWFGKFSAFAFRAVISQRSPSRTLWKILLYNHRDLKVRSITALPPTSIGLLLCVWCFSKLAKTMKTNPVLNRSAGHSVQNTRQYSGGERSPSSWLGGMPKDLATPCYTDTKITRLTSYSTVC